VARLDRLLLFEQELFASPRAGKADILDFGADAEESFFAAAHLALDLVLEQDVSGLE